MTENQGRYASRRAVLGAGVTLLGLSVAGCVGRAFGGNELATETVERTFAAPDVSELRVTNAIGDVTVAAVGTGGVDVRVLARAPGGRALEDVDVDVRLDAGVLTVETAVRDGTDWVSAPTPSTDVRITVPEGVAGPELTSVVAELGSVTLLDTRGDTEVRTDLGDVTVGGADGYLSLRSRLGTILASDVTGLDSVHTDLGRVKVDLLGLRGAVDVSTVTGEVVVGVADDLDLDLLVETNANVDSNLPVRDSRTVAGRLTGRQNDGGHRLHVSSDFGDVSLRSVRRTA